MHDGRAQQRRGLGVEAGAPIEGEQLRGRRRSGSGSSLVSATVNGTFHVVGMNCTLPVPAAGTPRAAP
ncbi:hypothetical protein NJ76_19265, partial [Rhodococcus sp. IITR03]